MAPVPGQDHKESRRVLDAAELARAEEIVRSAWQSLPAEHRALLEAVGASQWQIVREPLSLAAGDLLRSADQPPLDALTRQSLDGAAGAWLPTLRVVLIDAGHPVLRGLDSGASKALLSYIAWHEWGHALAIDRCSQEDVEAGERLLGLAPEGVAERIRKGGYRRGEHTHEIVAEIYAVLIWRRREGQQERPKWINTEIYKLIERVTGWTP